MIADPGAERLGAVGCGSSSFEMALDISFSSGRLHFGASGFFPSWSPVSCYDAVEDDFESI
jgi:hypothetical protein